MFRTALITTFFLSSIAQAYIPPSFFIIRQLARKHTDIDTARIVHKLTFYKDGSPMGSPLEETIDITGSEKATVVIRDLGGSNEIRGATIRKLTSHQIPLLYGLQLNRNGSQVFEQFKYWGLPVKSEAQLYGEKDPQREELPYKIESTQTLTRFRNRIAMVINGDGRTLTPPQVWIEKDSYLPLRTLFKPAGESETLDVQFQTYQVHKSSFLPQSIEVYRDGTLWVRMELTQALLASKASAEKLPREGIEPNGDLQNEIAKYLKWIR